MLNFFNETINISKLTVKKKTCKETKNRKFELNFFDDVKENTLNEIFKNKNNIKKKIKFSLVSYSHPLIPKIINFYLYE